VKRGLVKVKIKNNFCGKFIDKWMVRCPMKKWWKVCRFRSGLMQTKFISGFGTLLEVYSKIIKQPKSKLKYSVINKKQLFKAQTEMEIIWHPSKSKQL